MAAKFSMVKVNVDTGKELNTLYREGGGYVPRTIILYASGKIMNRLYEATDRYKYYLDPSDPEPLLDIMQRALKYNKLTP